MTTLPQIGSLAKEHKISYSLKNKNEILTELINKGVIKSIFDLVEPKVVVAKKEKEADPNNYQHIKGIRTNPKVVEIYDKETGKSKVFPSTYRLRREIGVSPLSIKDGKTYKRRYEIKVRLTPKNFSPNGRFRLKIFLYKN